MHPYYICSICGKSTFDVDVDYLSGYDHLSCVLEKSLKMKKVQIENWESLGGTFFTVFGCDLVINDCTKKEKCYEGWVYHATKNPTLPFIRVDLWEDWELGLKIIPPNDVTAIPFNVSRNITKEHIKNPSIFLATVCEMMTKDKDVRKIFHSFT